MKIVSFIVAPPVIKKLFGEEMTQELSLEVNQSSITLRIVVVGDSVTMQGALASESLYASRLTDLLDSQESRRSSSQVEVLNLGVTGYNFRQERLVLEHHALRYDPDLIVWQIHDNDGSHEIYQSTLGRYHDRPFSAVARWAQRRIYYLRQRWIVRRAGWHDPSWEAKNLLVSSDELVRAVRDVVQRLSNRKPSVPCIVLFYPRWPDGDDWNSYGRRLEVVHRSIVDRLRGEGVDVLDLLPIFKAKDPGGLRVSADDPWHPNAEGHRLIALSLLPIVVEQLGLNSIPRDPSFGAEIEPDK